MDHIDIYRSIIEPSLERVPVLEIVQPIEVDGREMEAIYLLERTVLTAFDRQLSDHLSAADGRGFPLISMTIKVREPGADQTWSPEDRRFFPTIAHALKRAGEFALGDRESTTIRVYSRIRAATGERGVGVFQEITRSQVAALSSAIELIDLLGESDFLLITGSFSTIVVQLADRSLAPVILDIERGTMTIPSTGAGSAFVGPLFNPAAQIAKDRDATVYVTQVNHKVTIAKEEAILAFRDAAEDRIFGFDQALGSHQLSGYRLDAAETLVKRLRCGLGDNLLGLSEHAQITALAWASRMSRVERQGASDVIEKHANARKVRLISND
ncbi:MAG: hypothetical protein AAGE80_17495 [Pseudomonadota bacterium]